MSIPRQTAFASSSAAGASFTSISSASTAPSALFSRSQARDVSNSDAGSSTSVPVSSNLSASGSQSASISTSDSSSSSQPSSSSSFGSSSSQVPSASSSSAQPSSSSVPPSSSLSSSSLPPSSSVLPQSSRLLPSSSLIPTTSSQIATTTQVLTTSDPTRLVSAVPTSLSPSTTSNSTARRTVVIAGATAAAVGVLLVVLGTIFVYKRRNGRRLEFTAALGRARRETQGAGALGLLDDEDFDDDDSVPMRRYRDNDITHARSNPSAVSLGPQQSPAPSVFRSRAETGSVFREEVFPPPQGPIVDPLVGLGAGGFGHIVNDVMGPDRSPPAPSSDSQREAPRENIPSMNSTSSSLYADPFRDLSRNDLQSDPSIYYDRRASPSASEHSGAGSRPATPQSSLGLQPGSACSFEARSRAQFFNDSSVHMDSLRSYLSFLWPFHRSGFEQLSIDGTSLSEERELTIVQDGVKTSLMILENGVRVTTSLKRGSCRSCLVLYPSNLSTGVELVPYLHVLQSTITGSQLNFAYLSSRTQSLQLQKLSGDVSNIAADLIRAWTADMHSRAYRDVLPCRRFLVMVNPHGGQGKAKNIWMDKVQPIFAAAGCHVDLRYTGPASSPDNATRIAHDVGLDAYDALVPISGDGIVNEIINGLASRPDALAALQIPIATIPAGSGNALSVNILGPERVLDVSYAAMNAIKGLPIPLDICSVSQGDTRIFSFLSQAFGLMADLDMGTEWIRARWIGGIRFVLGYLNGAITGKVYNVEITLKIAESDKQKMVDQYNHHQQTISPALERTDPGPMVPLSFGSTDSPLPLGTVHDRLEQALEPGWHTFRVPVQLMCAGKLPWLSRDSMMLPLAMNDGLIDLIVVPGRSAWASIKSVDGQEEGRFMSDPLCYYFKVEAYRCTPLEKRGYISIDGESIPYRMFQVENHARLARIMSVEKRWMALSHAKL
ncbi:unnamed protein product [Mycena citricolor]|uniref:DAGKc domain-containing protein n=1 Tax=Mycena citricolor TaxID=2018698 RepID=A0AAD2HSW1_9AGAR|nr:unnamed protein product [Mycena citricolor]